MGRFARKTLRRMPPATREIARLANDLASVQTRLSNRIDGLVSMEKMANASQRVFCNNAAHAGLVDAALRCLKAIDDPALGPGARTDVLMDSPGCGSALRPRQALRRRGAGAQTLRVQLDALLYGSAGRGRDLSLRGSPAPLLSQTGAGTPRYIHT